MNKQEYLGQLRAALACLPEDEIAESVAFYEEMIDDRVADGLTEEDVVASLDDPKVAARTIIADLPVVPRAVARTKGKSRALYWTLLILGSPLWLTLLLAAGAVVLSGVIVIWSLILALWVLAAGLLAAGPLSIVVCLWGFFAGHVPYAVTELGAGALCFGLGLFCLHGALAASKALAQVSRQWIARAKAPFVKKKPDDGAHSGGGGGVGLPLVVNMAEAAGAEGTGAVAKEAVHGA